MKGVLQKDSSIKKILDSTQNDSEWNEIKSKSSSGEEKTKLETFLGLGNDENDLSSKSETLKTKCKSALQTSKIAQEFEKNLEDAREFCIKQN